MKAQVALLSMTWWRLLTMLVRDWLCFAVLVSLALLCCADGALALLRRFDAAVLCCPSSLLIQLLQLLIFCRYFDLRSACCIAVYQAVLAHLDSQLHADCCTCHAAVMLHTCMHDGIHGYVTG